MATVSCAYIANTINSLEDLINRKITKVLGITNEAKQLRNRLEKVLDVLEDAERKKIGDVDVKRWLVELREVVFESEKVIDYCRIESHNTRKKEKQTQQQVAACPRLLASCFSKSGLRDTISKRIRTLNIKMKAILKEKPQLNLKQVIIGNTSTAAPTQNSSQALPSNTCIGATIQTDTNYLVNILINKETNEEAEGSHHLMAIVGVGGIGKTNLARKIFNDERIRGSFDIRIWISQSSSLKDSALLAKIIDAAGGNPGKSMTRVRLEPKLATTIARKRFLIVFDDVSDGRIWENLLKAPLQAGARGSRILVTTREENVAIQMGAIYVHDVKSLSPEEGWLLLRESSSLEEEDESDVLVEIGLNISEKCNGLPLAIKIVGGILKRKEPAIKEWQAISESQTWSMEGLPDGIPRVLYLGYDDLPLNLKQIFLYCSLYPKNFCIDRHDLIKKWVSEGFVVKRDGATLEEIGEEYYEELVRRYLIYPEKECDDDAERCKIHDCLVNMARLLSPEEISVDEINKLGEITFQPCHVSLVSKGMKMIPEEIKTKEKLRTLLLSKNPLKDDGLRDLFTRLKLLRVLDISETSIEVIPDTLRNLLHLRYLNLSRTKINKLPESIGYLPFLQFLLLQECKRLHSLPKGIENLKNLRNFDLTGTTINRFLFKIGKLVNLCSLDFIIVNPKLEQLEEKGWSLGELKNLNKLRSLCILQIDKTRDLDEAKEALLRTKPCLKELELSCNNEATPLENPIIIGKIDKIFEELCPPPCLETLKIMNYFGSKYPSWLSIDLLSNLQRLELINCQFCRTLPPLGQLPKLVFLYIANASDLRDIGPDITGTGQEIAFPKLEKLHIQSLNNLESWTGLERPGTMPCLKAFQLESCPEIKFLPSCINHSKSLKELRIIDCKSLKLIKNLTGIKELSVWNTPNLRKISNLTSLEDLSISHSPNLEIIKNVNSLKSVQIFDYDLEAIPRWLKTHAVQIQSLDLAGTEQMLQRCLINGPDWGIIRDITRVYGHSNTCTYLLYNRSPFNLETNLSVPVPQHEENSSTAETVVIETILEETEEIFSEEESPIIDEIVTVAVNTRSKEPSASISINQSYPPTTTYTDNIPVNMSENIFGLSNSDTDTIGTSTGSLVRRRRRKNNITEVASIDADKNADNGNSMPSNLVFNFEFGMPNNASATKEKNTGQNDIDSLSSDFNSLGNSNMSSKTETLGHQSTEQYAIEKPRGSFTSNLFYSDPNVSTNEGKLVESTFTLNSRIETLSHQNSEKQSSEDTSLNSNFSTKFEPEFIQTQRTRNFDSILKPVSHEGIVEEANYLNLNFSTDLEAKLIRTQRTRNFNSILKPVSHEGIVEEANYFVKQPRENASSPALVFAGSSTSGVVSARKSEVNDKSSIKKRLKDYLIVILIAVSVMQLFLIIWLLL